MNEPFRGDKKLLLILAGVVAAILLAACFVGLLVSWLLSTYRGVVDDAVRP